MAEKPHRINFSLDRHAELTKAADMIGVKINDWVIRAIVNFDKKTNGVITEKSDSTPRDNRKQVTANIPADVSKGRSNQDIKNIVLWALDLVKSLSKPFKPQICPKCKEEYVVVYVKDEKVHKAYCKCTKGII